MFPDGDSLDFGQDIVSLRTSHSDKHERGTDSLITDADAI